MGPPALRAVLPVRLDQLAQAEPVVNRKAAQVEQPPAALAEPVEREETAAQSAAQVQPVQRVIQPRVAPEELPRVAQEELPRVAPEELPRVAPEELPREEPVVPNPKVATAEQPLVALEELEEQPQAQEVSPKGELLGLAETEASSLVAPQEPHKEEQAAPSLRAGLVAQPPAALAAQVVSEAQAERAASAAHPATVATGTIQTALDSLEREPSATSSTQAFAGTHRPIWSAVPTTPELSASHATRRSSLVCGYGCPLQKSRDIPRSNSAMGSTTTATTK